MEAKAVAKYVRMSPIKLKPVTDLVRGKDLDEALTILKFTPGKGAEIIEKVVKSAAANAENNFDMNPDNLYVAEVYAHQGPTMKRWRAGSQEMCIRDRMEGVAAVEKEHEERYRKLAENVKSGKVFARDEEVLWQCSNCGHQVVGKEAPQLCQMCIRDR